MPLCVIPGDSFNSLADLESLLGCEVEVTKQNFHRLLQASLSDILFNFELGQFCYAGFVRERHFHAGRRPYVQGANRQGAFGSLQLGRQFVHSELTNN
jgi:hypothetical protein